jgi:hypothetical protein
MVIGKKFWSLNSNGLYSPSDNPGSAPFGGVIDSKTNTINNIDGAVVVEIQRVLDEGASVGISGNYVPQGTLIESTDNNTIILSKYLGAPGGSIITNLVWWNASRPSTAGGDSPIQAILCIGEQTRFEFKDASGKLILIPPNTMVKGAVYYFQISEIITVGADELIGYSAN